MCVCVCLSLVSRSPSIHFAVWQESNAGTVTAEWIEELCTSICGICTCVMMNIDLIDFLSIVLPGTELSQIASQLHGHKRPARYRAQELCEWDSSGC